MPDSTSLAGLLDRADHVFSLARQLGESFHERAQLRVSLYDPSAWESIAPTFNQYCTALLDLQDAMQRPPGGFAPVAEPLLEAARIAREIRAKVKSEDDLELERGCWNGHLMWQASGVRNPGPPAFTAFGEFFDRLGEVGKAGHEQVNKARRLHDPFAFVDQPTTGKDAGIDTTPTLPKPPPGFIEEAARAIPDILANVELSYDGKIELIASDLARRLQDAKHTLAAAHWAIHESVQAGRLRAGRVKFCVPEVVNPGPRGRVWPGDGRKTIPIPKGEPASFNAFMAVATEALWTWWRSVNAPESSMGESAPDSRQFIERLLAGPDDVELTPREMALLEAHLRQPISFSATQREKRATDHSQTQANRNKLKLIRDFNRGLREEQASADAPEQPCEAAQTASPTEPAAKRSTERGEGQAKLIAAVTKHHQYADGSCLNLNPIGNDELAKASGVSPSTASTFFNDKFQGYAKYRVVCRDAGKLADSLKALNGEFSPCGLYGLRPAGEDDRDQGEDVLQSPLPPLTPTGRAVLDIIKSQPKGKGIIGKDIVKELKQKGINLKESTLRRHILPILIEHYGVRNVPAAGGYLIP